MAADVKTILEKLDERARRLAKQFNMPLPTITMIEKTDHLVAYDHKRHTIKVCADVLKDYTPRAVFGMMAQAMGEAYYDGFHTDTEFQKQFPFVTSGREKFSEAFGAQLAGVDVMIAALREFDRNSRMQHVEEIRYLMKLGKKLSTDEIITNATDRMRNAFKLPQETSELEVWSEFERRNNGGESNNHGLTPIERLKWLEEVRKTIHTATAQPKDGPTTRSA